MNNSLHVQKGIVAGKILSSKCNGSVYEKWTNNKEQQKSHLLDDPQGENRKNSAQKLEKSLY